MSNTFYNINFGNECFPDHKELDEILRDCEPQTYYAIHRSDVENSNLDDDTKKQMLDLMDKNGNDYIEIA